MEDFTTANKYINKILNELREDYRTDIYCFAKILSLIIHYELGKQDLLEYTVVSTYRFLRKRNRFYKLETLVLNFFQKKLPEKNSGILQQKELIAAFSELKKETEKSYKTLMNASH